MQILREITTCRVCAWQPLVPDSCMHCCLSRAIWDMMFSVVMFNSLILERIFFKVPIEGGRGDMMANVTSLSLRGSLRVVTLLAARRMVLIWGWRGSLLESVPRKILSIRWSMHCFPFLLYLTDNLSQCDLAIVLMWVRTLSGSCFKVKIL